MSLLETLIFGIGTGITKGAIKIWFKDNEIPQAIGESIVGLIESRISDKLTQRKVNRELEEVSEKVAAQLVPILESESANHSQDKLMQIASTAGKALDETPLSPELIVHHDLNPISIGNHFISQYSEAREVLNDPEFELYKKLILEASQYIVDIGSSLPSFNEKAFAEILSKNSLILDKADQIIKAVNQLKEDNLDQNNDTGQFEISYRRAMVRKFDRIDLFGVDLDYIYKQYRLSLAYVSLYANIEHKDDDSREIVEIEDLITLSKNIAVKGLAGSGKTTLLKWLVVQASSKNFDGKLKELNDSIPFFIRLRDFSETDLPYPKDFIKLNAPSLADEMPRGWSKRKLKDGNAMVLIDGLDELQESKREVVREWLEDLMDRYPKARYILSTRPYAMKHGWLKPQWEFFESEITDMNPTDIGLFIDHWHNSIKENIQDEAHKSELEDFALNLRDIVSKNRPIRKLATNPLLCALICAIHKARTKDLPLDRIELYTACTEMFLRRDSERKVDTNEYPKIGNREKRLLLRDLAYYLLRNNLSQIDIERCEKRIVEKMKNLGPEISKFSSSEVLRFLIERIGLLRLPTINMVDFPHKTFQEYFASQAILADNDLGLLIEQSTNDLWREVVILTTGLASHKDADDIIKNIIAKGNKYSSSHHEMVLLAAYCIEVVVELSPDVRKSVEKEIRKILPPKNISEAEQIAKIGDYVLPYLKYTKSRKVKESAACVRALVLIGGEQAFSLLLDYLKDTRIGVQKAILSGAKFTDSPVEYGQMFLNTFKMITMKGNFSLELFNKADIIESLVLNLESNAFVFNDNLFKEAKNLKYLQVRGYASTENYKFISNAKKLEFLYIDSWFLDDISYISDLKQLKTLILVGNHLSTTDPMNNLKNLETLAIHARYSLNISSILEIENLNSLYIEFEYPYTGPLLNRNPFDHDSPFIDERFIDMSRANDNYRKVIDTLIAKGVVVKPFWEIFKDHEIAAF